ncbi:MAG TPA: hypothetical protein VI818_07350, partial [Candidatus Thermoplasmatota archaeon]|nr:hypothetical protein [Candidatus Thermoplasmatota archaeon]
MALTATAAYFLASGLISLGLASLLFAWNFPDRLNRALGVAFVFQGLARTLPFLPDAPGPLHALRMVAFYLDVAYPFAILYVAAAYRDRYGRPGLRRIALPSLLVGGFVAEWLYLVDHDAFRLNRSLGFGLYWLSIFGPALMAAILASDAARSRSEARRRSLSLASLGFAFFPTAYVLHMWIPGLMAVVRGISTFKAAESTYGERTPWERM